MDYPSAEQITRHVNLRALQKNVTWKANIFMGSIKSVSNVLFPFASPFPNTRPSLGKLTDAILLCSSNEEPLPGYHRPSEM